MDFRLNELKSMKFQLTEKASEESLVNLQLILSTQKKYELENGAIVELKDYYPDYDGFKDGEPYSKSPIPNNPAFILKMITPEKPEGEISFVAIQQTLETGENDYKEIS